MPNNSNDLFVRFPPDGGLYRIHWAGRVINAKSDTTTPRVGIWLSKIVHENGQYQPQRSPQEKDKIFLTFLDESAGAVPKLAIDTYWRDGQLTEPPFSPTEEVDFELAGHQTWDIIYPNTPISQNTKKRWIASHEYELFGLNTAHQPQLLYTAPIVLAKTSSGAHLLIPAYEVFRAYFAGCSEFAIAFLSGTFQEAKEKLVNKKTTGFNENGEFEIELAKDLPDIATKYLSLFLGTEYGMRAASSIHTSILGQRATHPERMPWIMVRPPFDTQAIRLRVTGKWLEGNDRFLVYRIAGSSFPQMPFNICRIIDKQYAPFEVDGPPTPEGGKGTGERYQTHNVGLRITAANDSKNNGKAVHIDSLAIAWVRESLPKIKKEARDIKLFPKPHSGPATSIPLEKNVSVGNRSRKGTEPHASISEELTVQIVSRFDALHECLENLKQSNLITSWNDYALIRPQKVFERTYCALIDLDKKGFHHPWGLIWSPVKRSRLVWVGVIWRKGKAVYLIDIEPRGKNDPYYMLLFTPKEMPLKADVLVRLLDFCVSIVGRWPRYAAYGLQDSVTWVRGEHRIVEGKQTPNSLLSAIDRALRAGPGLLRESH